MKPTESKTVLITSAVEKYLEKNINLKIENKILIAFSSGPDSTVLLDVLYRLSEKYRIQIVCAYYNHKMRNDKELQKEIYAADKNCGERNIKLVTGDDDGGIKKDISELGIEGAARKHRYIFLEKVYKEENCDFTASGHNLDDQIETVIMRLLKGSGASGLKGISEKNGKYLRPLLSVSKKDIMAYLEENNIEFSIDKTNNEEVYTRNRVRHTLLPEVEKIFPGFRRSLINLSEKMLLTEQYIKKETENKIKWIKTVDGYYTDIDNFFSQHEIIQLEALYNAADMLQENNGERIPYNFLKQVIEQNCYLSVKDANKNENSGILSNSLTAENPEHISRRDGGLIVKRVKNSPVYLEGYGLKLFRTGDKLFFKKYPEIEKQKSFTVDPEDKKRIYPIYKNRYICIEEKMVSECTENDLWLDPEKIQGELFIRYRENGDRISLKGGKKKLKKLFAEMCIQMDHKDRIPLICDDTGILAVMGSVLGYRDRIAERIIVNKSSNGKVLIFRTRQV